MKSRFFTVTSQKNPLITIQAAAGHFATGSSHISHYLDISELKSGSTAAKNAARELALPYLANNIADVIVCMEGTEIIAAYLAEQLSLPRPESADGGGIYVVTPINSSTGHFIFHQNVQEKIFNKNVILMVASMTTGKTANRALECLAYYGGHLIGISSVFSALPEINGMEIHSLFTCDDIPDYKFYRTSQCEMCQKGRKLDAIIDSEGYTKI